MQYRNLYAASAAGKEGPYVYATLEELVYKIPSGGAYKIYDNLADAQRAMVDANPRVSMAEMVFKWGGECWCETSRLNFFHLMAERGSEKKMGLSSEVEVPDVQWEDGHWKVDVSSGRFVNWLTDGSDKYWYKYSEHCATGLEMGCIASREGVLRESTRGSRGGKRKMTAAQDESLEERLERLDLTLDQEKGTKGVVKRKLAGIMEPGEELKLGEGVTEAVGGAASTGQNPTSEGVAGSSIGRHLADGDKEIFIGGAVSTEQVLGSAGIAWNGGGVHLTDSEKEILPNVPGEMYYDLVRIAKKLDSDISCGRCPFFESAGLYNNPPMLCVTYVEPHIGLQMKMISWEETKRWEITKGYYAASLGSPFGIAGPEGMRYTIVDWAQAAGKGRKERK